MEKRILFLTSVPIVADNVSDFNTGNYVFLASIYSFLYKFPQVDFITRKEIKKRLEYDSDWIKKNYDILITWSANFFALSYLNDFKVEADFVKSCKIPYYVLGIGSQNDIENNFKNLVSINDAAKIYVDAILNSGGTLTLRGELTNDYLKSLGYYNLPVLGCPSIYINRMDYKLNDNKVSLKEFKPMFCAQQIKNLSYKLYKTYPDSKFFGQEEYLKALFLPDTQKNNTNLTDSSFIKLFEQGRILGDINYYPWVKQILDGKFNFSYGPRIHGNIIAIQNKVPACVKIIDSRTREITEFYKNPNTLQYPFNEKKDSLYDLYKSISFEDFNRNYMDKYNNFINFLSNITNIDVDKFKSTTSKDEFIDYLSKFEYLKYDKNYNNLKEYKQLVKILKKKLIEKKISKILPICMWGKSNPSI